MSLVIPSKPQFAPSSFDGATGQLLWVAPGQNLVWNDGDILTNITVGTIYNPNPNGSLAALPGPVLGVNLTLGVSASAGAPAQDYFGIVSFAGAALIESLASADFIISAPAGYLPTVLVTSTAAPAGATGFFVYLGTIPGTYFQQNHAETALDSTYTAANPLTNDIGAGPAAAGTSTGIIGLANEQSTNFYAGFPGGSASAGPRSLFGASQSMAPGWDNDGFKLPVLGLATGYVAMNLLQPYYPSMDNALAVGINIDNGNTFLTGGTGFYIVDSTQTACATVIRRLSQNPGVEANGDVGARVLVKFYSSALVVS